jgi:transmembrane sensor
MYNKKITKADIIKFISGNLEGSEKEGILKWLAESEENRINYLQLKALFYSEKVKEFAEPEFTEDAMKRFYSKMTREAGKRLLKVRVLKYAAITILFIGIANILWHSHKQAVKDWQYITMTVSENGLIQVFDLDDGTRVWLNKNTTFKYPKKFHGPERKVFIDGEAFFDVSRNPAKPFKVQTPSSLVIKVLGTSFNIKAFSFDKTVTTTLVEGTVILQNTQNDNLLTMEPGTQTNFNTETKNISIKSVIPDYYFAWQNGVILMHNTYLNEITDTIESLYNVKFKLDISKIPRKKYNFVIRREQSIDTIMEMLKFVAPINYRIIDNKIIEITNFNVKPKNQNLMN